MKCKSKQNLKDTWREFYASSKARKRQYLKEKRCQNLQPKAHGPSLEIRQHFRKNRSPTTENMARDLHVKHRNMTRSAKQQVISPNVSWQARDWDSEPLRKMSTGGKNHEVVTCLLWRTCRVGCAWPWSTQNLVPEAASESLRTLRKNRGPTESWDNQLRKKRGWKRKRTLQPALGGYPSRHG